MGKETKATLPFLRKPIKVMTEGELKRIEGEGALITEVMVKQEIYKIAKLPKEEGLAILEETFGPEVFKRITADFKALQSSIEEGKIINKLQGMISSVSNRISQFRSKKISPETKAQTSQHEETKSPDEIRPAETSRSIRASLTKKVSPDPRESVNNIYSVVAKSSDLVR